MFGSLASVAPAARRPAWGRLLLPGVALLLAACSSPSEPAPSEPEVNPEHEVIAAYSAAIEQVEPLRAAFVTTWERAVQFDDVAGLSTAMRERAMPAFDSLRAAVRAMPTRSDALKEVHSELVEAYDQFASELERFVEALSEDSRQRPVEQLIADLGALTAREQAYRDKLAKYYAENGVKLSGGAAPAEADEADDAAPDGAPPEPASDARR